MTPEGASLDRPITLPAQLLVEGRTPEIFFREFVDELGLSERVQVRTFGGIQNLQPYLELFTGKAAFKEKVTKLGVVRDAEAQPAAIAFQSVCSALRNANLPVPDAMQTVGAASLQVGVFILPDCAGSGMLETLCLKAAEECEAGAEKKVFPCVDEFLKCVTAAKTVFDNPTKARFASYALACGVVDPQLGRAAQKRLIPCRAKSFEKLASFVQELGA